MHSIATFWAAATILLYSTMASAAAPVVVYEDDFSTGLDDWVLWSDTQPGEPIGYALIHDTAAGTPAPSALIDGDWDTGDTIGNTPQGRHFGLEKYFPPMDSFYLSFDWRASASRNQSTRASIEVADAATDTVLFEQKLIPGGTMDTGWLTFPPTDITPYLPGGDPIDVYVRIYLSDSWAWDYEQEVQVDNFRLVTSELDPPPVVPHETDVFANDVDPWTFWQDGVVNHTYELSLDETEGLPLPSAWLTGNYDYVGCGHRYGLERTVEVTLPFVISVDWVLDDTVNEHATFQLLEPDGVTLRHTWTPYKEADWSTYAPPDLSGSVLGLTEVVVRAYTAGAKSDGPDNALWLDNFSWTAPCAVPLTFYEDADGDGYGNPASTHPYGDMCYPVPGWVDDATDCDDTEPEVFPGNPEVCDGLDNDCDSTTTEWLDEDSDGWPSCPEEDCDDGDPMVFPGAEELCNGRDDDCDNTTDLDSTDRDLDGDGVLDCAGDCDDSDPEAWPGAVENCDDEIDQDCDGAEASGQVDPDCGDGDPDDGFSNAGCSCSSAAVAGGDPAALALLALVVTLLRRRARRRRIPLFLTGTFWAGAAIVLCSSMASAAPPVVIYEDDFSTDLDDWVLWSDTHSGEPMGYALTHDTAVGNPAPSALIDGDWDPNDANGNSEGRHFGMEKYFPPMDSFYVSFDWRASSGNNQTTRAYFEVADAATDTVLYHQNLLPGGSMDTGWLTFPPTDITPYLPGGDPIDVYVRVYLYDCWAIDWTEALEVDNFRLVTSELDPPPPVPTETDVFATDVDPWTFWQDGAVGHTYQLSLDEFEGLPMPSAWLTGNYDYNGCGHRYGLERTVEVTLPFVISLDWVLDDTVHEYATFQLVEPDGITLRHTWTVDKEADWSTYAPPDLSANVLGLTEVIVRAYTPGANSDGPDNALWLDNFSWTAPCAVPQTFYEDADGDGYGNPASTHPYGDMCYPVPGWVDDATDCDDTEPEVFPGNPEVCDGLDNDCDSTTTEWLDEDSDGSPSCPDEDCDDGDPTVYPGAQELCNGRDDDCDNTTDLDGEDRDLDGDGILACAGDCDDSDAEAWPGAEEICDDEIDQDCDGAEASGQLDPDCGDGEGVELEDTGCVCGTARGGAGTPAVFVWLFLLAALSLRRRR